MPDFATLPARIEALAERLHMPGYPADQAPVVRALAAEVAKLLAEMDALRAEHAATCCAADGAREAAAETLRLVETRLTAADAAAAMAEQRVRSEMLAKVDAAAAVFRQGPGQVVADYMRATLRGEAA